jgi:hypothetical protein
MDRFTPDFSPDVRNKDENGIENSSANAAVLSLESQLGLRALYEYIDDSQKILNEIQDDLSISRSNPDGSLNWQKASERLGRFCIEADSWGFSDLYEAGLSLQMFLLNSGGRIQSGSDREILDRDLCMLSALLRRCENDYRWRLAVADTR